MVFRIARIKLIRRSEINKCAVSMNFKISKTTNDRGEVEQVTTGFKRTV